MLVLAFMNIEQLATRLFQWQILEQYIYLISAIACQGESRTRVCSVQVLGKLIV
jgi:hypothetical protein